MYKLGNIEVCWNKDFKNLNFIKQPVTEHEIKNWKSQGYYHNSFTGSMYDNKNPMPDWVYTVSKNFNLFNMTFTIYKMITLEIMPAHTDLFTRYSELYCNDKTKIRRVLVFLEDWQPGHYFEVNKTGVVNWKAGDYCMWESTCEHAASNIGIEPRYTLQITGHVL